LATVWANAGMLAKAIYARVVLNLDVMESFLIEIVAIWQIPAR